MSVEMRLNKIVGLAFALLVGVSTWGNAQNNNQIIRQGNEQYKNKKYDQAEIKYRKGLEKDPKSVTGQYNLSNSLYRQEKYKEAIPILDSLRQQKIAPNQRAQVYHNLGNNLLKSQDYQGAVEAYKNALKLNPKDEDTRYNLSYALEKLKQQQQKNQQQQNKDQKQDQQQNNDLKRQDADKLTEAINREEKELHKKKAKAASDYKPEKDW